MSDFAEIIGKAFCFKHEDKHLVGIFVSGEPCLQLAVPGIGLVTCDPGETLYLWGGDVPYDGLSARGNKICPTCFKAEQPGSAAK